MSIIDTLVLFKAWPTGANTCQESMGIKQIYPSGWIYFKYSAKFRLNLPPNLYLSTYRLVQPSQITGTFFLCNIRCLIWKVTTCLKCRECLWSAHPEMVLLYHTLWLRDFKPSVENPMSSNYLFTRVAYQILCISDIYIMFCKISYEIATNQFYGWGLAQFEELH